MALYAFDNEEELISANEAEPGKTYWCMDCSSPVKRRRGKSWFFHFYHKQASPQCRLYSKKEDHFLAQIQLQKIFPNKVVQLERPFIEINRVADACLEDKKIIFEVQCSAIREKEVEMRMRDYLSIGYEVIWLLDDKRYNKRILRPSERLLRKKLCYYISIKQGLTSEIYDQFEIFAQKRRVKKGRRLRIDLRKIHTKPQKAFDVHIFPKQVLNLSVRNFCYRDRTYYALQNHTLVSYWKKKEDEFAKIYKNPSRFSIWFTNFFAKPYRALLRKAIKI